MTKKKPVDLGKFFKNDALEFLSGAEEAQVAERAEALGLPLVHLDPHVIAPDPEQLRRLPSVAVLSRAAERGDRAAQMQLDRLRELGESMRQLGQIQPVIVYRDTDLDDPAVTHRLLNGQRRWSAALVAGLPTLWAVEAPRPSAVNRVLHQYAENERREGFTDMERAWSMQTLKSALEAETGASVAWEAIEQRMQISRSRRNDLMRLLRFPAEGQQIIQQHGWSEWTLRKLHQAMQDGTIDDVTAVDMLKVLADQPDVTAPMVQTLVEQYAESGEASGVLTADDSDDPTVDASSVAGAMVVRERRRSQRALVDVHQRLAKMSRAIEQFRAHAHHLAADDRQQARREATALRDKVQALLDEL
jgi:ParB/RepB/Spo0J family partition protein